MQFTEHAIEENQTSRKEGHRKCDGREICSLISIEIPYRRHAIKCTDFIHIFLAIEINVKIIYR